VKHLVLQQQCLPAQLQAGQTACSTQLPQGTQQLCLCYCSLMVS
jgi:hypothetical protein